MDVYQQYATDEVKELEGVWRDVGDSKVLVARAGNRKYARLLGELVESNQAALDAKTDASAALSDKIMIDVAAQTVLLGWTNVTFKSKDPLPYSVENARTLLAVKDFRQLISKLSNEFEAYRAAQEATNQGN